MKVISDNVGPHIDNMKNEINLNLLPFEIRQYSGPGGAKTTQVIESVSYIFTESFGFRPDNGRSYRLGSKLTRSKLNNTEVLFLASSEGCAIGYLYGKQIPYSNGKIAWIESLAVLPFYRRKGTATTLVKHFMNATEASNRLGCATPNPIAAYVLTKAVQGKIHIGPCHITFEVRRMLNEIKSKCIDLQRCKIDAVNLRINTGFSPQSSYDHRSWKPRETNQAEPPWWNAIEFLPNEFEALVVVDRQDIPVYSSTSR